MMLSVRPGSTCFTLTKKILGENLREESFYRGNDFFHTFSFQIYLFIYLFLSIFFLYFPLSISFYPVPSPFLLFLYLSPPSLSGYSDTECSTSHKGWRKTNLSFEH
jgi:hypothetical protein